MKKITSYYLLLIVVLSASYSSISQEKYTISGYLKNEAGEELIGATAYIKSLSAGTATNVYGFYSLTVQKGTYQIIFSYLGYTPLEKEIVFDKNTSLNVELQPQNKVLDEVVITAEGKHFERVEMSVEKLEMKKVKLMPSFMGEVDIIKSLQLLPGIQSGGEGSSGLYVRGGSADQNLILLDEAPVYNASHLMGFFSVFNSEAIKDMTIYKGGIPAEYGGRLSSLIDIRMKDGNKKDIEGSLGMGSLSSWLTVQGPIEKDKSSFIISARRTYFDLFLLLSKDEALNKTKIYFYDLNAKFNYQFNNNNRLFISAYTGRDIFKFDQNFKMGWGNFTTSARWNHLFSDKLFSNTSFIFSNYDYNLGVPEGASSFEWSSSIQDYSLQSDYTFFITPQNTMKFGIHSVYHHFKPGKFNTSGESFFNDQGISNNNALEYAAYLSNEQKFGNKFIVEYGLRYSLFQQIGSNTVYNYLDPEHPTAKTITDSTKYDMWKTIQTYGGFEPRLLAKLQINDVSSIKSSYVRTRQYLHLVTNTNSPSPTDIWIPSNKYIKPQIADQVALGYFRNFKNDIFESSIEVYYKDMKNQIDYLDGADLLMNEHIETEIRRGIAYSYGTEFTLKKVKGKFTGTLGYTLAKVRRKIPEINEGKEYAPSYDRTHDIVLTGTYEFDDRWTFSANWIYTTGAAVTFPVTKYEFMGTVIGYYAERNSYRLPDYHRLDLSATLTPRKNAQRKVKRSWNFSLYNAYARKNAYSIYFRPNEDNPEITEAVKLSIVGTIIPSVTYNLNF